MRKLIMIELNEVPLKVIDRYVAERPHSTLALLAAKGRTYETVCEDEVQLDPWISWPTLHRGVVDREHGILHLGQSMAEVDRRFPPIWELLSRAGRKVGVFGSLHSNSLPPETDRYPFYLPDFFASEVFAKPSSLKPFQTFNVQMTRESARNVSRGVPAQLLTSAAASYPSLGLKWSTLLEGAKQVASEVVDKQKKVRRRNYQSLLMVDVFVRQLKENRPDFATFYTNSVAASMHRYWAALFPEDYDEPVSDAWRERYKDEIFAALDMFDLCLSRIMAFVRHNPEYGVVMTSSMGQGAIPFAPVRDFLTVENLGRFMDALGLERSEWTFRPAMVPCMGVMVQPQAADRLRAALATVEIGGHRIPKDERPIMPMAWNEREAGFFHFYVQFDDYDGPDEVRVGNRCLTLQEAGLGRTLHEDGVNCTAQHQRNGSLIVYREGEHESSDRVGELSTLDIAPSLLSHFGVERPAYMTGRPALVI